MNMILKITAIVSVFICFTITNVYAGLPSCLYKRYRTAVAFVTYNYKDSSGAPNSNQGTGFVITQTGHIITAAHVITARQPFGMAGDFKPIGETITVRLGSSQAIPINASVIKRDLDTDVALIKIPIPAGGEPFITLPIGDSTAVSVGDPVTGIGYPNADISLIPTSIITAPNALVNGTLKIWWQTGLALNSGDSGARIAAVIDCDRMISFAQR